MRKLIRKGDLISHGGYVQTGSSNIFVNGIPVARVGDAVHCNRHGSQQISTGSLNTKGNSDLLAREGDTMGCGALLRDGSPDTFCNS